MSTVKIIQRFDQRWDVVTTDKKVILQADVSLANEEEATNYIKNYCSSFVNWTYEVEPLKKKKDQN